MYLCLIINLLWLKNRIDVQTKTEIKCYWGTEERGRVDIYKRAMQGLGTHRYWGSEKYVEGNRVSVKWIIKFDSLEEIVKLYNKSQVL